MDDQLLATLFGAEQRTLPEALALAEEVLPLDPSLPSTLAAYWWRHVSLGDTSGAERALAVLSHIAGPQRTVRLTSAAAG